MPRCSTIDYKWCNSVTTRIHYNAPLYRPTQMPRYNTCTQNP